MKTGKLVCPACGHSQGIDPKYEGQQFACPGCGKAAHVVTEGAGAPPPPSGPGGADQAKAAAQAVAAGTKSALVGLYAAGKDNPLFVTTVIDALLDKTRLLFKAESFLVQTRIIARLGHYAALLVAVGCIPFGIVLAVRMQSWQLALAGPLLCLAILFLQYVAAKFLELGASMREGSEIHFSSRAFFDVNAAASLALIVLGVIGLCVGMFSQDARMLMGLLQGGRSAGGLETWIGAGGMALFLYFSCYLHLNPERLLNARIDPRTTGGETFVSLLTAGARAMLALTPVIFGLGCLASGAMVLYYGVGSLFSEFAQSSLGSITSALGAFTTALLTPLILCMLVLVFFFLLDLALAVFRIARNTEK